MAAEAEDQVGMQRVPDVLESFAALLRVVEWHVALRQFAPPLSKAREHDQSSGSLIVGHLSLPAARFSVLHASPAATMDVFVD
jgi:hypothetical protein